jgi:hypothetical protein
METDAITIGTQVLSPTGRIWTIRSITPSGSRVVLASDQTDGEHAAIMDRVAVLRMVRIDQRLDAGTYVERSAPAQDLTAA